MSQIAVVTGAFGFIGSHLVDLLLDRGYAVRALDDFSSGRRSNLAHQATHPRLEIVKEDARNIKPGHFLFNDARFVFHAAGIGDIVPSIERPVDYLSVNVMGTVQVLEAARRARVAKFVYTASSSCYGKDPVLPTDERAECLPAYPYALSKYLGEEAVMHWQRVYGLPAISMRIFNAYGPRSRTTGAYGAVFKVFLAQKLHGKPFTVVGDGTQRRDFVYVTDVARALVLAAESDRSGEIYNVGTGKPVTVNRLVELLGGEVVHVPKRPGEPDYTWADITKIREDLGWVPQVPFEAGVAELLHHRDDWVDAPVWDPASIQEATRAWFEVLR